MMLKLRNRAVQQVLGHSPKCLADILRDDVNLAVWQRQLPAHVEDFATLVLGLQQPLGDERVVEVAEHEAPSLPGLLKGAIDVQGYDSFVADVEWLVAAYACLLGARRVGLRVRVLESAMCPRFHVDHVPLRLLSTYAGAGSEWLAEGAVDRSDLPRAMTSVDNIKRLCTGDVAILKGEQFEGNEGHGIIHRSPQTPAGERRLLLSLDWLA
ncbi:DUF1826 domain-containing protein [Pseudomonas cremoricolorata]|uniref:Succinylglutamate desuccinylase n=1 Tax=Pseudomonas cremoricolorata TaxID=157783 RepID=A0A089WHN4_9PSED|nr:DUF1826 domain-containing protein [Pseudomonas cremoricolorata]AIR88815.1 hypothetical protein LK03_05825 [Pseudomonas cremoricolorata]